MYRNKISELKIAYPIGTRIRLVHMDDVQAPPSGTIGTIMFVDDMGQIHVHWSTGSTLALIPDVDEFEFV